MIQNVSVPAALIAGLVSFLSPCVLPLVPPYLIYLTGATIDDVARAAGVSRQTVSNVVHGGGRLGAATRDRVLAAIEQLDYQPHAGAASLRSGRTYRIGYPIPDTELRPDNAIMLEFLHFLVAAAGPRGSGW